MSKKPKDRMRYARVPMGSETCPYCIMLASRGFVYTGEDAAAHSHSNCDCLIVPGFQGETVIDGCDYETMARNCRICEETVKCQFGKEWDSLDPERQMRLIVDEIATRDPRWLRYGTVPKVDYSEISRESFGRLLSDGDYSPENIVKISSEWRDLFAHDALAKNGFNCHPRKPTAPDGYSNIDILINGQLWEIKSPEQPSGEPVSSDNLSFVESNLRKAKRQFGRQYNPITEEKLEYRGGIRVVFNLYYREVPDKVLIPEIRYRMKQHRIDQVLLIRKDGTIVRLTR